MTERGARADTLGLRLAMTFLAVAFAAIALLAGLAAIFTSADVSSLTGQQRQDLAAAISVAAGSAWNRNNSWASADLTPIFDLAQKTGVEIQVFDAPGHVVASSPGFADATGPRAGACVIVRGQHLGRVQVRFTGGGLGGADTTLRTALLRAIAGAAGLAAVLALVTGLLVARRITRPIARLISVTRSMAGGDRASRAGDVQGLGELRELAAAFDQMADTLDQEDKIRRDLVAGVAHELRTPIAVLQAGHEALLDGVAEPTPEELSSLRDEVLRLARMVVDLQTMAAADAAVLHLTRHRCDLADIAAAAADSLARRFEAAGIELDRQLSGVPVFADPRWLHQVVTNLLTNALKFTPAGGRVTISTRAAADDAGTARAAHGARVPHGTAGARAGARAGVRAGTRDAPGQAVLEVADTGIGIPADDLPRVFERFWRGQRAGQTSGSGIGLAIAAELARAHGGKLTAASTEGAGTTMTLTLPRA